MNGKDFCLFSLLSLTNVFYFIGADIWIKPNDFILKRRLATRFDCLGLNCFQTNGNYHFMFFGIQYKSIFNRTSGSNINLPYLRKSWLKSQVRTS